MHKSTQVNGERLTPSPGSTLKSALDTLEQLPPAGAKNASADVLKNLEKRARSKFVTNIVAMPLAQLNSPLQKAYRLSAWCSTELTETAGKITSKYCGCRWCLVCSRMRTARLIKGYFPAIEAMGEKWFLTLSRPNVAGPLLEAEVKYYLREASLIQRHLREKRKLQYSSLRKIECTYNEVKNTYHPHFHFIFDNFQAADLFLQEWLARNPTAILNSGNQLIKADNNSVMELFKYFTKVVSKPKSTAANVAASNDYRIHLAALDTMFLALRAVRTFQPCGVIKAVSEEIELEQSMDSGRDETHFWKWRRHDWVDRDTERALTGYIPAPGIQEIAKHVVYPTGVRKAASTADLTPFYVDKLTGEVVPNENAHLVRFNNQFAKVYPLLADDKPKRGDALRPTSEADFQAQPPFQAEAAAVPPVSVPAPPVAPQMALFELPAPRRISTPAIKKAARPTGGKPAHRAAALVDLSTGTPSPLLL